MILTIVAAIPQRYRGKGYTYPSRYWTNPYWRRPSIPSHNYVNQVQQQPFARYTQRQQPHEEPRYQYQSVAQNSRYQQYQPSYESFNTYTSSSTPSYNNWQAVQTPLSRQTFQPQLGYNLGNNYNDQGVIWSSQWTEWLPVSKVRWDLLRNRTYARKVIDHIPPRTFVGQPTNEATETYQGVAKRYYSGIFPSIEDEKYTLVLLECLYLVYFSFLRIEIMHI